MLKEQAPTNSMGSGAAISTYEKVQQVKRDREAMARKRRRPQDKHAPTFAGFLYKHRPKLSKIVGMFFQGRRRRR